MSSKSSPALIIPGHLLLSPATQPLTTLVGIVKVGFTGPVGRTDLLHGTGSGTPPVLSSMWWKSSTKSTCYRFSLGRYWDDEARRWCVVIKVVLDQGLYEELVEVVMSSPFRHNGFREEGGYLLGFFLDRNVYVTSATYDRRAEGSMGLLKLSYEAHQDAQIVKERLNPLPLVRVGTWHTHPPGFGPDYSYTDERHLFLESMVLTTDDPSDCVAPTHHLILSSMAGEVMAKTFRMFFDDQFILDPFPSENKPEFLFEKLVEQIASIDEQIGLFTVIHDERSFTVGKNLVYRPKNIREATEGGGQLGMWKRFDADIFDTEFEAVFLENFWRKVKPQEPFPYLRVVDGDSPLVVPYLVSKESSQNYSSTHKEVALQLGSLKDLSTRPELFQEFEKKLKEEISQVSRRLLFFEEIE